MSASLLNFLNGVVDGLLRRREVRDGVATRTAAVSVSNVPRQVHAIVSF
jgi:hypothetical protein